MRRIGLVICALFLATLIVPAAQAERRVALVIGNSAYRYTPPLNNPRHDAADIAAVLRKHGFQVIEGLDLDKAAFDRKVGELVVALKGADAGVFFYAGHGLQVAGKNYLVPVDAKAEEVAALDLEMVRVDTVHGIMERQTETNILFLDACRDNPLARNLARSMGTRSSEIGRGLSRVEAGVGTLISFSTQPGNVALDGDGRNSPYTGALVKHLAASKDDLSAILIDVRNDVMRATRNRQVPWEHVALRARFYFGRPPMLTAPGVASLPQASEAALEWSRVDKSSLVDLETFRRRHPSSPEAEYAQARIDELKKQQAALTAPPSETSSPGSVVRLGLWGNLTETEYVGHRMKNGVELAVEDINAAGGILGRQIEISMGDHRGDFKLGAPIANKLVADGAEFVIGNHVSNDVTTSVADVYQKRGILMITPHTAPREFRERKMWNVIGIDGFDDHEQVVAADYIANSFKEKRIAIVYNAIGARETDNIRKAVLARGIEVVLDDGSVARFDRSEKDIAAVVRKLKAANPALVYWSGTYSLPSTINAGHILREMRRSGLNVPMMGSLLTIPDIEQFSNDAEPYAEGTLRTQPVRSVSDLPGAKAVIERLRARKLKFEWTSDKYDVLDSYAAVQIIKQAAEGAGSLNPRRVAAEIRSGRSFQTVLGDLSFDQHGVPTVPPYVVCTLRKRPDGKYPFPPC